MNRVCSSSAGSCGLGGSFFRVVTCIDELSSYKLHQLSASSFYKFGISVDYYKTRFLKYCWFYIGNLSASVSVT